MLISASAWDRLLGGSFGRFDQVRQATFRAVGGVLVDDILGASLVKLASGQPKFGISTFKIAIFDGGTYFGNLSPHLAANRSVTHPMNLILTEVFLSAS